MDDVRKKVVDVILEQSGADLMEVTDEARLEDLGFYDDLDSVELQIALEDSFDREFPDDGFEQRKTVGEVVAYVRKHLA